MVLLILPLLWAAVAGGSQINRLLGAAPRDSLVLERRLFGLATGLVLAAYSILLLGLCGLLAAVPIMAVFAALFLIGWNQHVQIMGELAAAIRKIKFTALGVVVAACFAVFAVTSLIGCFTPPTSAEYDSLSYHLADPKIYLIHHRIVYLPWESHSNFAFTMEMLYTAGLSLHSVALAKLFHFTMGVVCILATYLIGRRIHSTDAGVVAGLLLLSLPLIFWEAGTAYVDLAAAAFGALSLLALIVYLSDGAGDKSWLRVAAIMTACMVSVKATSLITAVLFAAAILVVRYVRSKKFTSAFYTTVLFGLSSVVGGSVWYVKSWIITGNPFFPFAYSIFGGKHWSTQNAVNYAHSQAQFGAGHRLLDLLLVPWNLTLYSVPAVGEPAGLNGHPFNDYASWLVGLSPVLLAALLIPAFWNRKSSPIIRGLALYGLITVVIWFFLTQQVRYLLPVLPVYCLLTSIIIAELWQTQLAVKTALSVLYAVSILFSGAVALMLVRQQAPVVFGIVDKDEYVTQGLASYPAMQYLNSQTPKGAGVVFYGEPTDYYCDRPYMWGESGNGIVIPYDTMSSPSDLKKWLIDHGFHYIFIDYFEAPITPGPGMNGLVDGLTKGSGNPPVYSRGSISIYDID
jgi:hypothetical protein